MAMAVSKPIPAASKRRRWARRTETRIGSGLVIGRR
jgi:hypothetical protein